MSGNSVLDLDSLYIELSIMSQIVEACIYWKLC